MQICFMHNSASLSNDELNLNLVLDYIWQEWKIDLLKILKKYILILGTRWEEMNWLMSAVVLLQLWFGNGEIILRRLEEARLWLNLMIYKIVDLEQGMVENSLEADNVEQ